MSKRTAMTKTATALKNKYNAMVSLRKLEASPDKSKRLGASKGEEGIPGLADTCDNDESGDVDVMDTSQLNVEQGGTTVDETVKAASKQSVSDKDDLSAKEGSMKSGNENVSIVDKLADKIKAMEKEKSPTDEVTATNDAQTGIIDKKIAKENESEKLNRDEKGITNDSKLEISKTDNQKTSVECSAVTEKDIPEVTEKTKVGDNSQSQEGDSNVVKDSDYEKVTELLSQSEKESKEEYRKKLESMINSCKEKLGVESIEATDDLLDADDCETIDDKDSESMKSGELAMSDSDKEKDEEMDKSSAETMDESSQDSVGANSKASSELGERKEMNEDEKASMDVDMDMDMETGKSVGMKDMEDVLSDETSLISSEAENRKASSNVELQKDAIDKEKGSNEDTLDDASNLIDGQEKTDATEGEKVVCGQSDVATNTESSVAESSTTKRKRDEEDDKIDDDDFELSETTGLKRARSVSDGDSLPEQQAGNNSAKSAPDANQGEENASITKAQLNDSDVHLQKEDDMDKDSSSDSSSKDGGKNNDKVAEVARSENQQINDTCKDTDKEDNHLDTSQRMVAMDTENMNDGLSLGEDGPEIVTVRCVSTILCFTFYLSVYI